MRNLLTFIVLLLVTISAGAQTTVLRGTAKYYIGQQGALLVTNDFVSGHRSLVTTFEVGEDGSINLEFEQDVTHVYDIQINGIYGRLVVEPGQRYEFVFPGLTGKRVQTLRSNQVDLEFINGRDNVNEWIARYNQEYENYFAQHADDIAVSEFGGSSSYLDSRRSKLADTGLVNKERQDTNRVKVDVNFLDLTAKFEEMAKTNHAAHMRNPFFADYVNYSIALAKLSAGETKEKLFQEYIEGRATSANNPEYCSFIDAFYGNYFLEQGLGKLDLEILRGVNVKRDPAELDSVLQDHDLWSDGEARRLAILCNLYRANYQDAWDKTGIRARLEKVGGLESFEQYADVAEAILLEISTGQKGYKLRDFRFVDYNNDVYTNETFAGKYTYFVFFTSWCRTCVPEFKFMEKLYLKYDRQIEFVLDNLDEDYLTYLDFLQQHPEMEKTIVYGLSEPMVFDIFDVQAVPEAVLMSPDGKLIYDYTRKPSEGVSLQFDKLVNRKQADKRPRVGSKTN